MAAPFVEKAAPSLKKYLQLPAKEHCRELKHRQKKLDEANFYGFHDEIVNAESALAELTGRGQNSSKHNTQTPTSRHPLSQIQSLKQDLSNANTSLFFYQQEFSVEKANVHNLNKASEEKDRRLAVMEEMLASTREQLATAAQERLTAREALNYHQTLADQKEKSVTDLQLRIHSLQVDLELTRKDLACCQSKLDNETRCKAVAEQKTDRLREKLKCLTDSTKAEGPQGATATILQNAEQRLVQLQHVLNECSKDQWKADSVLLDALSNIRFLQGECNMS